MTGSRSKTVRIIEIAELLGVTKQRAHQIAGESGFPAPVAEDVRGRLWSRYEVQAWRSDGAWRSPGGEGYRPSSVRRFSTARIRSPPRSPGSSLLPR
jgi:predicted DNA-binding transcriptional regulator AlpA